LSLMQEGLGLAFTYQAPILVVDVMRSGPSTGKPTRAGQGEILGSKYGTHGDVCPFVFYSTSVQECYDYTIKAFQVAWENQVPVILLSDAYLAHLREQSQPEADSPLAEKINHQSSVIKHYSGLIDRKSNSKKIEELTAVSQKKLPDYNLWGNDNSDTLLIGLGSMARALRAFEDEYQIFAPVRVWPFLKKEILATAEGKENIVVVEMNEGQYVKEVKQVLGDKVEFVAWREETINIKRLKKLIRRDAD